MEDFILRFSEKLLKYKKGVFQQKTAREFVEKQIMKSTEDSKKELKKCLFPKNIVLSEANIKEREEFINIFLEELKSLQIKKKDEEEKKEKEKNISKKHIINNEWMPKMKINDENFPTFANSELVKRKKNYVVLDRHYQNRLEPGIKECFCMSTRHPLVGNCLECGRIHCLQEGDKKCIACGAPLILKDEYLKQMELMKNNNLKNANIHKDKLLQYQKDFYSKLQIIDDFSDWYEVSNNTWLDEKSREEAKKKDEESAIMDNLV
jgi:hypothetical protein